jgi:hypothetical protein
MAGWEVQNLGWSYSGMLFFVGIPALVMRLMLMDIPTRSEKH